MDEEFTVQLRLPRRISEGDIIEVKARIKHPVTTGLQLEEGNRNPVDRFSRAEAAVFVREVEVYYGDALISTFSMNSSTSNDPLLAFMVRADKQADLRVVVTDYAGNIAEASETIAF